MEPVHHCKHEFLLVESAFRLGHPLVDRGEVRRHAFFFQSAQDKAGQLVSQVLDSEHLVCVSIG